MPEWIIQINDILTRLNLISTAFRILLAMVCGGVIDEAVKNDIAVAARLNITATTLAGILDVKRQGQVHDA